ncbi:MAG: hypothetical protein ACI3YD_02235 [Alloprevotella sp.]
MEHWKGEQTPVCYQTTKQAGWKSVLPVHRCLRSAWQQGGLEATPSQCTVASYPLILLLRASLHFFIIGCGSASEVQNEKLSAFLLHFARLALSLRGIIFLMNENIV